MISATICIFSAIVLIKHRTRIPNAPNVDVMLYNLVWCRVGSVLWDLSFCLGLGCKPYKGPECLESGFKRAYRHHTWRPF